MLFIEICFCVCFLDLLDLRVKINLQLDIVQQYLYSISILHRCILNI